VREALCSGEIDVITFTSSSTVRNFAQAVAGGDSVTDLRPAIGRAIVAAIGPITADTARSFGLEPDIVAPEHTIPGLVASLENHLWTT